MLERHKLHIVKQFQALLTLIIHTWQSGGASQFSSKNKIEPGEAGSGYEFKNQIKGEIYYEHIPGVEKGLIAQQQTGVLQVFMYRF